MTKNNLITMTREMKKAYGKPVEISINFFCMTHEERLQYRLYMEDVGFKTFHKFSQLKDYCDNYIKGQTNENVIQKSIS